MAQDTDQDHQAAISSAIFCAQDTPPGPGELADIRRYIRLHPALQPLEQAVLDLEAKTCPVFASLAKEVTNGPGQSCQYAARLRDWLGDDDIPLSADDLAEPALALPILLLAQVVQYFQYLGVRSISHAIFLEEVEACGILGTGGGFIAAVALTTSRDEVELVRHAAICVRVAMGMAILSETGLDGEDDTERRTDWRPEAAEKLCRLCDEDETLKLPRMEESRVRIRSQFYEDIPSEGPWVKIIANQLTSPPCDWQAMCAALANDLKSKTQTTTQAVAVFGPRPGFSKNLAERKTLSNDQILLIDVEQVVRETTTMPHSLGPGSVPEDSIAIIGAACRLPGANSLDELWGLIQSTSTQAPTRLPSEREGTYSALPNSASCTAHSKTKQGEGVWHGHFINDMAFFDNAFFNITPQDTLHMDPHQRVLLELAYEALDSSGCLQTQSNFLKDGDHVGCFIGASPSEYSVLDPASSTQETSSALLSGRISHFFNLTGPSEVLDTGSSSSLVAIHRAVRALQTGECRAAIAGGINLVLGTGQYQALDTAGLLTTEERGCIPFEADAEGYTRADGAGLVVLKKLTKAVEDGDEVLGVIPAIATNHSGLSTFLALPRGGAQVSLFEDVLRRSGLKARHVSYVEAHAAGNPVRSPLAPSPSRGILSRMGEQRR